MQRGRNRFVDLGTKYFIGRMPDYIVGPVGRAQRKFLVRIRIAFLPIQTGNVRRCRFGREPDTCFRSLKVLLRFMELVDRCFECAVRAGKFFRPVEEFV